MKYVLVSDDTGMYVAAGDRHSSYTMKLENARIFTSRQSALDDACGNESVRSIDDVTRSPQD